MIKAELVSVGTELLLGDIVNTNAAYLARALSGLGIGVYWQSTVGDNRARLLDTLRTAHARASLVVVTGGLGPTNDDITMQAAAEVFGVPLELDAGAYARLCDILSARGIAVTESQKKQAMLPRGCTVLPNDYGTASGALLERDGRRMLLLPGPPRECEPLFAERAVPLLRGLSGAVLRSRNIHIFGMGEAAVGDALYDLLEHSENPTFAPYCIEGEVRVRITASGADEDACVRLLDAGTAKIRESRVGAYIYGTDCRDLQHAAVAALSARGKTVAAAESCTGGLVARRIADVPGASAVMEGCCVTYANRIKEAFAGVRHETLQTCGAVSEEVAREMAEGIRRTVGADFGLATTGNAGPGGGTPETPVGLVFVACASDAGTEVRRLQIDTARRAPEEGREYVRRLASSHALHLLLKNVEK